MLLLHGRGATAEDILSLAGELNQPGFAYLAPFYGVRSTTFYGDPDGFAKSHLRMARSAFSAIGAGELLHVRSTHDILPTS